MAVALPSSDSSVLLSDVYVSVLFYVRQLLLLFLSQNIRKTIYTDMNIYIKGVIYICPYNF